MATNPSPASDRLQPNPEVVQQQANEVQQDVKLEANKPDIPKSVFVNSEPIREDQVMNAVKFLSHPKVKGSPVIYRRSFLERKGLTKEEIDEAFRRVPDPPPRSQPASLNQVQSAGQGEPSDDVQTQATMQAPQPAAAPTGITPVGTLEQSRFHWYHALSAIGLLAASGACTAVLIKNTIIPRLKSWICKVVLEEENNRAKQIDAKPSLAEEAAAAAKAAAAAAADIAKASQEMMSSKNEERRRFEEFMTVIDSQVQEMKSMSNAIRKLEGQPNSYGRTTVDQDDHRVSTSSTKQLYANGRADADVRSVRSSSPPTSAEPSHPKSYMEIMAMVQRGEKPSNIREIDDMPPNPNQQPSNPRLAPRTKPWEVKSSSSRVFQSQGSGEILNQNEQDNGLNYLVNDESSTPWWQRKNVRITEIENEVEVNGGLRSNEPAIKRTWVPPQPSPVAMAEAAEAIRRPKPSAQGEAARQEQLDNDDSVGHSSEVADAKSESATTGAIELKGSPAGMNSTEIEEV